jgi:YD repeat-containing protein
MSMALRISLMFLLGLLPLLCFGQGSSKKSRKLNQMATSTETIYEPALGGPVVHTSETMSFNERGDWYERISYNRSGDITRKETRVYEGKRLLEETLWLPSGKKEWERTAFTYDDSGACIAKALYRKKKLQHTDRFFYDKGLLVKEVREDPQGHIIREKKFAYTFYGAPNEPNEETE